MPMINVLSAIVRLNDVALVIVSNPASSTELRSFFSPLQQWWGPIKCISSWSHSRSFSVRQY